MAIRDPKVLVFALMACCLLIGTGFANFFPTYVHEARSPMYGLGLTSSFNVQDCGNARILDDHDPTPCSVCTSINLVV